MDNYGLEPDYNGGGITKLKPSFLGPNLKKGSGLHEPLTTQKPAEGPIAPLLKPDKGDSVEDSLNKEDLRETLFGGKKKEDRKSANSAKRAMKGGKPYQSKFVPREGKFTKLPKEEDLNKSIDTRIAKLRKSIIKKQQVDNKDPKLFLDQAIASIDQVLGKLDKHRNANDKADTVNGISDTTVQSYDVWSAGTPNKQGKAIDGSKTKNK